MSMPDQTPYWIALSRVPGIGPVRMRRLLDYFGDPSTAWDAMLGDLMSAGLEPKVAEALVSTRRTTDPDRELDKLNASGAHVLTWDSPDYPERLREVDGSPPVLYVLGEVMPQDSFAVAIVGTRRVTPYGRAATAQLASELAQAGITVTSGLARGVDTIAHSSAIDSGGRTLAVLGSEVDIIYPPENKALARRIVEEGAGAIISEYPLGTLPDAINFPPRNRIISGLSLGVLVVEAGERSGALITISFALEQNRDVFAIPGPITSRMSDGPNALLKKGAKCVTCAQDILDELQIGMVSEHVEAVRSLPADPTERMLLEYLQESSQHIDELTNLSGLPASTVSAVLTMMELKGLIRNLGGMQYSAR
jgi:DNA processing protein